MNRSCIQNRNLIPKINEYMFNKKESIVIVQSDAKFDSQYEHIELIAALYGNLHDLGYEISNVKPLFDLTKEQLKNEVYEPLLKAAKEAKGANVEHRLLFPDFPDSVRSVDLDTLSNIRFISYFTTAFDALILENDALADGSVTREIVNGLMADAIKNADITKEQAEDIIQKEVKQNNNVRVINIVEDSEFFNMVKNMLSARTSLSPYDREIVEFAIDNFDKELYMPNKVQFKETQAFLDKCNFEKRKFENIDVKSFNDLRRLLIVLSDGDMSKPKEQKIKNFGNQDRKAICEIFNHAVKENYPIMLESFAKRESINFADAILRDRLHLDKINGSQYKTFMKKVEKHQTVMSLFEKNLQEGKYKIAASILEKYSPTLMIQHAKNLLTRAYEKYEENESLDNKKEVNDILKIVKECAKKTDIKTNLSLEKAMEQSYQPYKILITKDSNANVIVKENKGLAASAELIGATRKAIYQGIDFQLSNYEMGGKVKIAKGTKVYIEPCLKECPIPTVGRSDMGKNRTVATGTKLPVQECDILRAALYKQNNHNQFIDFSAGFFDENYNMVGQVSWNNLKESKSGRLISYHSGDTSNCSGKGCTEIIDIDLNAVKENFSDARYVAYMAVMWNGTKISSCNQIFMTLSPTNELGKNNGIEIKRGGDAFNPEEVQFKIDVVGDARANIPMLYDLKEHKAIIVNMDSKHQDMNVATRNKRHFNLPVGCECLENYHSDTAMKLFAYENMNFPTMHDLASLYVLYKEAELVENPNKADVVFAIDRIQLSDEREKINIQEGEETVELPEQVIITPFDKDIITAELIPDPKNIGCEIEERQIIQTYNNQDHDLEEREM